MSEPLRRGPAGGHEHGLRVGGVSDQRRLAVALGLILAFMVVEVVAGIVARSLAILSDAGHMVGDAGALGLSIVAIRLAARPAGGRMTYGLKRAEILSALANGIALFVMGALVVYEAIRRLISPPSVEARMVLGVALAGIALNVFVAWQISRAQHRSLNVEGSFQHILTDLYGFIGTALAAGVIMLTGFERADPAASLFVAALMFRAALGLVRDAGRVLLEAAPTGVDPGEIASAIGAYPAVTNVHDLHVWEITTGLPALSAHVLVKPGEDCHAIRRGIERLLEASFHIEHTTLQVDHQPEGDPLIRVRPIHRR